MTRRALVLVLAGALVAALLLSGGAWWVLRGHDHGSGPVRGSPAPTTSTLAPSTVRQQHELDGHRYVMLPSLPATNATSPLPVPTTSRPNERPWFQVRGKNFMGHDSCNTLQGIATVSNGRLALSDAAGTMAACTYHPPHPFGALYDTGPGWKFTPHDGWLEVFDGQRRFAFVRTGPAT